MVKSLNPESCIRKVLDYFNTNLKNFNLIKSSHYTGYWWIEYENKEQNLTIYFDGDIGGHFYVKIFIGDAEYYLWQFDCSVNNRTQSTDENILFQLETLKRFLSH